MLGKLIKYEFKETGRILVPLLILVALLTPVLGIICHIFAFYEDSVLTVFSVLSVIGFIILLIGIAVAFYVIIVYRFYTSMTSEKAYLTFMLPVSTTKLILSKLLVAFVWQFVSVITITLAIAGFTYANGLWTFSQLNKVGEFLLEAFRLAGEYQSTVICFIVIMIAAMFFGTFANILQTYLAIAFGQTFTKYRLLMSFAVYFAIYTITQIISSMVMLPFQIYFMSLDQTTNVEVATTSAFSAGNAPEVMIWMMVVATVITIIYAVGFFFGTTYLFKKKLNLL